MKISGRDFGCAGAYVPKIYVIVIARSILDEEGLSGLLKENTQFENQDFRKTFFKKHPEKCTWNILIKYDSLSRWKPYEHIKILP